MTATASLFAPDDVDGPVEGLLPSAPGLDTLLASSGWHDLSIPAQPHTRTLKVQTDAPGVAVLTFRDGLVDVVAVRESEEVEPGRQLRMATAQATLNPDGVVPWLRRWALGVD